jgi:hypothetical protein
MIDLLQCFAGPGGGLRAGLRRGGRLAAGCGAVEGRQFHAQPDKAVQCLIVDLAGYHGGNGGVAGEGPGGVAVEPGRAVAAPHRGGRPRRGPLGPDSLGPLPLQRGAGVHHQQVGQGNVGHHLRGLPGPLGHQAGGQEASHRVLKRVVVALRVGTGVLGARGGGQRVEHHGDGRGALRSEVAADHARALERRRQLHGSVIGLRGVILGLGQGAGMDLRGQLRQAGQIRAAEGGGDQDRVGLVPAVLRQFVGPGAQGPGHRLGYLA